MTLKKAGIASVDPVHTLQEVSLRSLRNEVVVIVHEHVAVQEYPIEITTYYLSDLGEARDRQELFTKQSPWELRVLREHALIVNPVSYRDMSVMGTCCRI